MSDKRKRGEEDLGLDPSELDMDLDNIEDIDKLLDSTPGEKLDSVAMKRMLVSFERSYTKNHQLRIKYPNQFEKFVESEVDLDEEIKKLRAIATAPHLYPEFIQLKAHETILSLFIHENTDITIDALELVRELTDTDVYEENPENSMMLIEALLEHAILELLVSNLHRLQEMNADEKQGVFHILSILENLIEAKIELCDILGEKTEILSWLLKRIQVRDFDDVKQYSSEILSIMLQNSKANQIKCGKLNGIDIMLMTVARYKKANPPTKDEEELVENIFNCLCVVCPMEENKKFFTQAEGLKLLQIMIKNKKYTRKCALKLLDHVCLKDPQNCRRWVQLPGLGTLFAAFMKKGAKKHKKGFSENEDDEHIASIMSSMLKSFETLEQGKLWSRIIDKFREKDYEKVERLMELHEKYNQRVKNCDLKIVQQKAQLEKEGELPEDEDEFYLKRLDAGLFTLQLVDFILATICQANTNIKQKAKQLLHLQGSSFEEVKKILLDYASSLAENFNTDTEKDVKKIQSLANDLTVTIEEKK